MKRNKILASVATLILSLLYAVVGASDTIGVPSHRPTGQDEVNESADCRFSHTNDSELYTTIPEGTVVQVIDSEVVPGWLMVETTNEEGDYWHCWIWYESYGSISEAEADLEPIWQPEEVSTEPAASEPVAETYLEPTSVATTSDTFPSAPVVVTDLPETGTGYGTEVPPQSKSKTIVVLSTIVGTFLIGGAGSLILARRLEFNRPYYVGDVESL